MMHFYSSMVFFLLFFFSIVCTDIENCADIRCTTPSDHYCEECESNRGLALGERGYENLNTSCERKYDDQYIVLTDVLAAKKRSMNFDGHFNFFLISSLLVATEFLLPR